MTDSQIGLPFRMRNTLLLLLLACVSCRDEPAADPVSDNVRLNLPTRNEAQDESNVVPSRLRFIDVSHDAGIDHTYYGSPSPQHYMTEQNGGGTALFDYDGDGSLDLFFVNGSHFEREANDVGATNRLYVSHDVLKYDDVTELAGLTAFGHGMGCTAADFDNDGFVDLFVAYYGRNRLWHNNGDGTFDEVTETAGVGDDRWGTSAAFADFDGDGNLDLYVANYVEWSPDEPPCQSNHRPPVMKSCSPTDHVGQIDLLYRNRGDGAFDEIGRTAGIAIDDVGKGLAVGIADLDGDARLDIVVANDTTPNFLFRNLGGMKFEEVGVANGAAYNQEGVAGSSMGVAVADYNGDGRFDFAVTNFLNEVNDLFENLGGARFRSTNTQLGLDAGSRPRLAFGILFADFDRDTHADLFVANGHIWDFTGVVEAYQYAMPPQLLHNEGGSRFREADTTAGDYFQQEWLGRSAAVGDLDNDGDADLVVTHLQAPAAVLRNDSERAGGSVVLQLVGTRSSRQPLGAPVFAVVGERTITLQVAAGGSFQSSSDPRVIVPTGDADSISKVRVVWPGGLAETWSSLPASGELTLVEGTGESD